MDVMGREGVWLSMISILINEKEANDQKGVQTLNYQNLVKKSRLWVC